MSYWMSYKGCRDGAVVRALTSHQCGPGSIPRSGVMSVEFVGSLLCTERFSLGTLVSLVSASSTRVEIKYVILRPNESRKVIRYNVTSTQPPLALFPSQQRNGDLIWSAWVQFPAWSVFFFVTLCGLISTTRDNTQTDICKCNTFPYLFISHF